jgi:hypothetical protein
MKNIKVYIIALLLILGAAAIIKYKISYGGGTVQPEYSRNLWKLTIGMNLASEGGRVKIRMVLPQDTPRQKVYNEIVNQEDMDFYTRQRAKTNNRIGFWLAQLLDGVTNISYTFSVQLKSLTYVIPADASIPKKPSEYYPKEMLVWLDPSRYIQSHSTEVKQRLREIIGRKKLIAEVNQLIFSFVRDKVAYKSEKGSRSADEALDKLVADCGGQARLFVAFCRAAGIPSRIVGGIIVKPGFKNTTHVWAENYIGGQWIPFDVVNNHYAFIPNDYLEIYRGDYALIKYVGCSQVDYFFLINKEKIPPIDQLWSLYSFPFNVQKMAMILLLIPIGALIVSFFRVVIGITTFGTFTPVILALAFRGVSIWTGIGCIAIMITLGWVARNILDHLKILVIPRISIIVTTVVMMTVGLMMVGFVLGIQKVLYIALFPMIITTWIIERFSVLQVEDGTKNALIAMLGTVVVSAIAYYTMGITVLRTYLFTFPELLLVVVALLLLLGRYTGLRVTEILRFKDLLRKDR